MAKTVMAEALEQAIKTKREKKAKTAPPVETPAAPAGIPAQERIAAPAVVYTSIGESVDSLFGVRKQLSELKREERKLVLIVVPAAKAGPVQGKAAIALFVTGEYERNGEKVPSSWLSVRPIVAVKPAPKATKPGQMTESQFQA